MRIMNTGATYFESGDTKAIGIIKPIVFLMFSIIAVFTIVTGVLMSIENSPRTVSAQETDPNQEKQKNNFRDAGDEYFKDDDKETVLDYINRTESEGMGAVVGRLLLPGRYINDVTDAYVPSDSPMEHKNLMCDVNDPGAGTAVYHNCDVPNPMTEFLQSVVDFIGKTGISNAERQSPKLDSPEFGLPTATLDFPAPANPDARAYKYSALELYGYNLRYSLYSGEWDDIKVMTSARILSNFGLMDSIGLGVKATMDGVISGLDHAARNFLSELSDADIVGAFGALFSGYEVGAAQTLTTVLDTSDFNVLANYAWYRKGYGDTLYNAKELSNDQIAANAVAQMIEMISGSAPENAKVPDDFASIKNAPEPPRGALAQCTFKDSSGNTIDPFKDKPEDYSPTEEECQRAAARAQDVPVEETVYDYDPEGKAKAETLKQWVERDKHFSIAKKYNMQCEPNFKGDFAKEVSGVMNCWADEWLKARTQVLQDQQESDNAEWAEEMLSPEGFAKWIAEDPARNFNAPWNRYMCMEENNIDIRTDQNNRPRMLFQPDGTLTPECMDVRPPIQDGFFGNGYESGKQAIPGKDTRNLDRGFVETMLALDGISNWWAQAGLNVATFFTRVSNTVINLSFMPISEQLGLDDIVVSLIESFRDGIFYPLIVMSMAIVGVVALFQAMVQRNIRQQLVNMLLAVVTVIAGFALLHRPADTLKAMETVPANLEAGLMGAVFEFGTQGNEICSVTGPAFNDSTFDFSGNSTGNSVNDGVRTLMCETWRAFAFTPWVRGQWGTEYENLYANTATLIDGGQRMENTNRNLVGNAAVYMGGRQTINNWAIYQLDTMSSGTAYEQDPTKLSGEMDKNFYKIMDMQAGPNNGEGRDGRYFHVWTGQDYGARNGVAWSGAITSAVGTAVIISYSIAKIQITLIMTIMMVFLPFVMLIGVLPGPGRRFLKGYVATMVGLLLQRLILVVLMALMFKVLIGFSNHSEGFLMNMILVSFAAYIFLKFKKEALDEAFNVTSGIGSHVAKGLARDPMGEMKKYTGYRGGTVENAIQRTKAGTKGAIAGAAGGLLSRGGIKGAMDAARENWDFETGRAQKNQRRLGWSPAESFRQAYKSSGENTRRNLQREINSPENRDRNNEMLFGINEDRTVYNPLKGTEEDKKAVDMQQRKKVVEEYNRHYHSIDGDTYRSSSRDDNPSREFKIDPSYDGPIDTGIGAAGIPEEARVYKPVQYNNVEINNSSQARKASRYLKAREAYEAEERDNIRDKYSTSPKRQVISEEEFSTHAPKVIIGAENVEVENDAVETETPKTKPKKMTVVKRILKKKSIERDLNGMTKAQQEMEEALERYIKTTDLEFLKNDILDDEKANEYRKIRIAAKVSKSKRKKGEGK